MSLRSRIIFLDSAQIQNDKNNNIKNDVKSPESFFFQPFFYTFSHTNHTQYWNSWPNSKHPDPSCTLSQNSRSAMPSKQSWQHSPRNSTNPYKNTCYSWCFPVFSDFATSPSFYNYRATAKNSWKYTSLLQSLFWLPHLLCTTRAFHRSLVCWNFEDRSRFDKFLSISGSWGLFCRRLMRSSRFCQSAGGRDANVDEKNDVLRFVFRFVFVFVR